MSITCFKVKVTRGVKIRLYVLRVEYIKQCCDSANVRIIVENSRLGLLGKFRISSNINQTMDPEEFKEVVKIDGNSSEEDSDSESKIVRDLYEKYKPPPILIDPKIHKIIEVGSNDVVGCQKEVKEKDFEPIDWEVKLTKRQKKRQRKMQQQNRINVTKVENDEEASKKEHEESDYVYFENKKETVRESNEEQSVKFEIGGCHKKENVLSRQNNEFFENGEFRSKTDKSGKNLELQASQLCFLNYTEGESMGIEENSPYGGLGSMTADEYLKNIKEERTNGQFFLKNENFTILHRQENKKKLVETLESKESEILNKKDRINTKVVIQNKELECLKLQNLDTEVLKVTFFPCHKGEDILEEENKEFLESRESKTIADKSGTNIELEDLQICLIDDQKEESVPFEDNCFSDNICSSKVDECLKNNKEEETNGTFFLKDEDFPILHSQENKNKSIETLESKESEILNRNIHVEDVSKKKRIRKRKKDRINAKVVTQKKEVKYLKPQNLGTEVPKLTFLPCNKEEDVLQKENKEFLESSESRTLVDKSGTNTELEDSQICFIDDQKEESVPFEENCFSDNVCSSKVDEYLKDIKEEERNSTFFLEDENFPVPPLQADKNIFVDTLESKESGILNKNIQCEDDIKNKRNKRRNLGLECLKLEYTSTDVPKVTFSGCHNENILKEENNEFFEHREFGTDKNKLGKNLESQASLQCILNYTKEESMRIQENSFYGGLGSITVDEYLETIKEEKTNGQFFLKNEDFPTLHLQKDRNKFVQNLESKESELPNKNIRFEGKTKKKRNRKRKKNCTNTEIVTPNKNLECLKFENTSTEVPKITFAACYKEVIEEILSDKEKTSKPQEKIKDKEDLKHKNINGSNAHNEEKHNQVLIQDVEFIENLELKEPKKTKTRNRRGRKKKKNPLKIQPMETEKTIFLSSSLESTIFNQISKSSALQKFDISSSKRTPYFCQILNFIALIHEKELLRIRQPFLEIDSLTKIESVLKNEVDPLEKLLLFFLLHIFKYADTLTTQSKHFIKSQNQLHSIVIEDLTMRNRMKLEMTTNLKNVSCQTIETDLMERNDFSNLEKLQIFPEKSRSVGCQTDFHDAETKEVTSPNSHFSSFDLQKYPSFAVITGIIFLFLVNSFLSLFAAYVVTLPSFINFCCLIFILFYLCTDFVINFK